MSKSKSKPIVLKKKEDNKIVIDPETPRSSYLGKVLGKLSVKAGAHSTDKDFSRAKDKRQFRKELNEMCGYEHEEDDLPVDGRDIFLRPNERIMKVVIGADLEQPTKAYVSSLTPPFTKGETTFVKTFTLPDPQNPGRRLWSSIPTYHLSSNAAEDSPFWNDGKEEQEDLSENQFVPFKAKWYSAKGYNTPDEVVDVVSYSPTHKKFQIHSHEDGETFEYWVTADELSRDTTNEGFLNKVIESMKPQPKIKFFRLEEARITPNWDSIERENEKPPYSVIPEFDGVPYSDKVLCSGTERQCLFWMRDNWDAMARKYKFRDNDNLALRDNKTGRLRSFVLPEDDEVYGVTPPNDGVASAGGPTSGLSRDRTVGETSQPMGMGTTKMTYDQWVNGVHSHPGVIITKSLLAIDENGKVVGSWDKVNNDGWIDYRDLKFESAIDLYNIDSEQFIEALKKRYPQMKVNLVGNRLNLANPKDKTLANRFYNAWRSGIKESVKFENISCSQCGQEFGPGNYGYSQCKDYFPPAGPMIVGHETERQVRKILKQGGNAETVLDKMPKIKSTKRAQEIIDSITRRFGKQSVVETMYPDEYNPSGEYGDAEYQHMPAQQEPKNDIAVARDTIEQVESEIASYMEQVAKRIELGYGTEQELLMFEQWVDLLKAAHEKLGNVGM